MILILFKKPLIKMIAIATAVLVVAVAIYTANTVDLGVNSNIHGYIALVIDDFGNNGEGTDAMLQLGIPMTAAVMPFAPDSARDAIAAHEAGLEVILHIPMEAEHGKKEWLGPRGITTNLSKEEIQNSIKDALDEVKYAVGMNNHMGSKATQDPRVMESILEIAKEKDLLFLDSVTTQNSVVGQVAERLNVTHFKRDIFLDNSKRQSDIEAQLRKLGDVAINKGYAIGIRHVGPEGGTVTAKAIKAVYPELKERGIEFIYISQLKNIQMRK